MGVLKWWKNTVSCYDPVINNCHEFVNDLCCQLCGRGFVQGSNTFGHVLADGRENFVGITTSKLPQGLGRGASLLLNVVDRKSS